MTTPRRVEFTRFVDPFTPPHEQDDEFEHDHEWAFARRVFLGRELKPAKFTGYFVQSNSLGFVPLGEHNLPSRKRKLWEGHSNFRLTGRDQKTICAVDGVAGFTALDPYKFLVAVGWMFKDEEVTGNIRKALCPPPAPPPPADALERAAGVNQAWAIVRDGETRGLVTGLTREEVEGKLAARSLSPEKVSWRGK